MATRRDEGSELRERPLGKKPAADLNGNASNSDSFPLVVVRATDGWVVLIDTNLDDSFEDETPLHDYRQGRETLALGTRPITIAANFSEAADQPVLDLVFDTSAHGTFVAGVAAGHRLYNLQGFNGAGLYTSNAANLDDGIDSVTAAVRGTWASLWNDRAFEERDYYRIDHRATKMGVLSHPSVQDEQANGVAITRNPFREGSRAYFVNAQLGNVSVVFSEAVPEQFLYYAFNPPEVEYLSHSSLTFGAPVLDPEQIAELIAALQKIHVHFYQYFGVGIPQSQYAMDVEWKFGADGGLIIKQARPYLR